MRRNSLSQDPLQETEMRLPCASLRFGLRFGLTSETTGDKYAGG
jgi:hypothetical protein